MRQWTIAVSPVAVIALCNASQHIAGRWLGVWAWAPTMLLFWGAIAALVAWSGTPPRQWLGRPRGSWFWSVLAVAFGLLSADVLIDGWHTLGSPAVLVLWLLFGLLNPWFEEMYWRGLLIDATRSWPIGLGVVYSAAAFALSHPYIWGVHTLALRSPRALVGLGVAGLVWGLVYRRTGSLRFTILGHALSNLLGLSVPVLLNLHTPAALR